MDRPSACGALVRKIGTSTMKAAPRNEPRIEPSPPMMTMNSTRNDSVDVEGQRLGAAEVEEDVAPPPPRRSRTS